jgi:hypothetical protein
MSQPIFRVTLFKIPREEDQQKVLDIYNSMPPKVIKVRLASDYSSHEYS